MSPPGNVEGHPALAGKLVEMTSPLDVSFEYVTMRELMGCFRSLV